MSERPRRKSSGKAAASAKSSRKSGTRSRRNAKPQSRDARDHKDRKKQTTGVAQAKAASRRSKARAGEDKAGQAAAATNAQNNGRVTAGKSSVKPPKKASDSRQTTDNSSVGTNQRSRSASFAHSSAMPEAALTGGRTGRLPKTHLSAKELREFRILLLQKRAEICGDVEQLTDEALYRAGDGERENAPMPIHMADLGSDNWEQDFTLNLLANERDLVREIDEALARIQNKTYGICLATHAPIGVARLRAKPWAKYCIEYARAKEEGRVL